MKDRFRFSYTDNFNDDKIADTDTNTVRLCWTVFSSVSSVHRCVYNTDAKSIVDLFSRRIFAVRSSRIVLFVMKTVDLVVSHCV